MCKTGIPYWTTDIGGFGSGDTTSADFRELIVRWFQFGAFSPLFRLHGHRGGASAPPADACGPTNGDNEVWNLARSPPAYAAIAAVMRLREQLRGYVWRLSREAAQTGMPLMRCAASSRRRHCTPAPKWRVALPPHHPPDAASRRRPMALAFPADAVCAAAQAEAQFMLGPDWLVAPVTTENATSWPVYLPPLDGHHVWMYHWNSSEAGNGWASVDTRALADFPLFFVVRILRCLFRFLLS